MKNIKLKKSNNYMCKSIPPPPKRWKCTTALVDQPFKSVQNLNTLRPRSIKSSSHQKTVISVTQDNKTFLLVNNVKKNIVWIATSKSTITDALSVVIRGFVKRF